MKFRAKGTLFSLVTGQHFGLCDFHIWLCWLNRLVASVVVEMDESVDLLWTLLLASCWMYLGLFYILLNYFLCICWEEKCFCFLNFCIVEGIFGSVEKCLQEVCSVMYFRLFRKKQKTKNNPTSSNIWSWCFLKIFIKVLANCPWLHTSRYHGIIVSKNTLDCTRPLEII